VRGGEADGDLRQDRGLAALGARHGPADDGSMNELAILDDPVEAVVGQTVVAGSDKVGVEQLIGHDAFRHQWAPLDW
jgi:hypothetical protein